MQGKTVREAGDSDPLSPPTYMLTCTHLTSNSATSDSGRFRIKNLSSTCSRAKK